MKNHPYVIDCHQDIALASLYTTRTDFLKQHTIHEGSNDLGIPVNNQSDLPRLKLADVRVIFGSICPFTVENGQIIAAKDSIFETQKQLHVYKEIQKKTTDIYFIKNKNDLKKIKKSTLGILLHLEGADMLTQNPEYLKDLYALGFRSIGLTWNFDNGLAGGASSKGHLSETGKIVIQHMEKMGIIVDLAHLNADSALEVLNLVKKPCFISHTNCNSIFAHNRCVSDEILEKVAKTGGIVCISGVPEFIAKNPTIDDLCNHIQHAIKICGIDHVGIGSDFSVMTDDVLIPEFGDVSDFPNLSNALYRHGLSLEQIEKIFHSNILKFISSIL